MTFIGFLVVVLLFRLYIYNLESEERKEKYEKKPIKINEESHEESHVQFHYFDEEDNCIEDYEEYTNRMQEIWGYDPYNVEPIESYCEKAIHIE